MNELIIDIQNRCRNNTKRCKCNRNKVGNILVKTGNVKSTDFGYCTHEGNGKGPPVVSDVKWNEVDLERRGSLHPFADVHSVTVFYHSKYGIKYGYIKKPLLIRTTKYGKTHWYENLGHYANKKWRRLSGTEALGFPKDNYMSTAEFEKRLKSVACRLHISHYVKIYSKDGYTIKCEICDHKKTVQITPDKVGGAEGYKKYIHTDTLSENSILVYKKHPLTFPNKSKIDKNYYLPITIDDPENYKTIAVYYWDKDEERNNPLLIEFETPSGYSRWIENISPLDTNGSSKHDKWRPIGYTDSNKLSSDPSSLKRRLDSLSCIYNKTVQIHLGKQGCHDFKHFLHRERIYHSYGEVFGTYPVLYSYKYLSSLGRTESFNISEVSVGGRVQNFKDYLPFRGVTRLTVFVSPCNRDKPFLLCVSNQSKNHRWYIKRTENGNWEGYPDLHNQSPDIVKDKALSCFKQYRDNLKINDCSVQTSDPGIKLDIKQTPGQGERFLEYRYSSVTDKKNVPIFVTKENKEPVVNFFRNMHKPATRSGTFVLSNELQNGGQIGGSKIPAVQNFRVYFWQGEPEKPILLGIKKSTENDFKYYSHYGSNGEQKGRWLQGTYERLASAELNDMLDDQNCKKNNAIPIELINPTNIQIFNGTKISNCLQDKLIALHGSLALPKDAEKIYEAKSYKIDNGKRISRVTYKNKPTNIPPYTEHGSTLNIYYWKEEPGVPLMVEFKPTIGQSTWYENLGGSPPHTNWIKIDEAVPKKFYESSGSHPQNTFTEEITKKLNEVNCRIHSVVQIDVSKKAKETYCHNSPYGHVKKIMVTPKPQSPYYDFIGYEHTPVVPLRALTISSFYNSNIKQEVSDLKLPLEHVKKVIVYFPVCDGGVPVAIKIEYEQNVGSKEEKWLKREENNMWKEETSKFSGKDETTIKSLLDTIRTSTDACKQPPVLHSAQDDPDEKITWDNITTDFEAINEELTANDGYVMQEEYADEEMVEEQLDITFVNDYPSEGDPASTAYPILTQTISLPNAVIDIKQKPDNRKEDKTYQAENNKGKVYLEKEEEPEDSMFLKFTHQPPSGVSFKVDKVLYRDNDGDKTVTVISANDEIQHLAVWYWKNDQNLEKPLFIEVVDKNGDYHYHSNKGNNDWNKYTGNNPLSINEPLEGEELEKELDDLNCYLNQAVTMDLSFASLRQNENGCNNKIEIGSGSIKVGNSTPLAYYTHSIKGAADKCAKLKYYIRGKSERRRITAKGLNLPIGAPVTVYTFCCLEKPALIYIDSKNNTRANVEGWYKRGTADEDEWIKLNTELNGIPSNNFDTLKCEQQGKLVEVLMTVGCSNLQKCSNIPGLNLSSSSLSIASAPPSDQRVTIKLSERPNEDGEPGTTYEGDPLTNGKLIKVTGSGIYSDFLKYEHTSGQSFKLIKIEDDSGTNVLNGMTQTHNVLSVSAYYWKHENISGGLPKNALLVEVTAQGGNTSYYSNSKSGIWSPYNKVSGGEPSQAELELLNCEINDVVQIDVTKITDYCHESTDPKHYENNHKKIKVERINDGGNLGNYVAFEHAPNEATYTGKFSSPYRFNISGFTKKTNPIILTGLDSRFPLRNAKNVIVYFCQSELTAGRTTNPLLIYVEDGGRATDWYQKPTTSNEWAEVAALQGISNSEYTMIVDTLDTIKSACQSPKAIIDIYERENGKYLHYYSGYYGKTIEVTQRSGSHKKDHPEHYTRYDHQVVGWESGYFTLQNVNYHGKSTSGVVSTPMSRVTKVSVYYWSSLESPYKEDDQRGRPLLVKIAQHAPGEEVKETYYENKGDKENLNWQHTVTHGQLEAKLNLLNCKLNNAVVINVNERPKDGSTYYDACDKEFDLLHGDKMQVKKEDYASGTPLGSYECYTHTLEEPQDGGKFHITEFMNGRTTLSGIFGLPIMDVDVVKVYFCSLDKKPLLLYYETNRTTHHWYKNTSDNDNPGGSWEKETSELSTINDNPDKNHEKILQVLNGLKSSCKPATQGTKAALGGASAATVATFGLGSILGTSSGTLAGAGATFFGGWKLYNRYKGDPWVRQI